MTHRSDAVTGRFGMLAMAAIAAALVLVGCAAPGTPSREGDVPFPSSPNTSYGNAPARDSSEPTDAARSPWGEAASAPTAAASAGGLVSDPDGEIVQRTPRPDDRPVAKPVPIDPLQPDVKVNLDDAAARADLWTRVRRGFAIPDLDNELVRDREQWYATRPDYVARMTERSSRYLFHIVEEVERRGMPTELALLPFIESAFNPQAMSTAQASGMWQFIPSTGKDFELRQNMFRDDRRDVLASTRAALDYLARLHSMFGDWHLALAAYNWGEGSVQRAIARNQKLGLPTNYSQLNMPTETRQYVPKLQAVKNIIARPHEFDISLPELDNHPYFLSVPIERDIDVSLVMRFAGMHAEEFKTLNPQLNKPVILAAGTPQVLLPYDNASLFIRSMAEHRGSLATWTAWTAPRTLRPAEVAKLVGMDEPTLRQINHIPAKMLIKAGSTLLVRRHGNREADVSDRIANNAFMTLAPDVPPKIRVSFKAGKADSVTSVAKRWNVSPAQVASWNKVKPNAVFKSGQTVVVFAARNEQRQAQIEPVAKPNATEARKAAAVQATDEARRETSAAASPRIAAKPVVAARKQASAKSVAKAARPNARSGSTTSASTDARLRVAEGESASRR